MTSLYLTTASADAAVTVGSGTKWKAGWAPGASSRLLNKNTVTGPTASLQMTDSATAGTDGTAVSFYTEPLWGVTIAGQIIFNCWTKEAAAANNVRPEIGIERCDGAGNILSTICNPNTTNAAGEVGTTVGGSADSITVTATNVIDTTLADGDRLRITLWINDAVEGTTNMASGGNAQFWINGPNGAAGASEIIFTEIVQPQAGPRVVTVPETSWTATTTPKTLTAVGALSGDLMMALVGGDNFSGAASAVAYTTTGGTTGAWTKILEALVGTATSPWKSNAWANVTASADATVSIARTQGTAQVWGAWLAHIRNHGGIGNVAELVDSATDSVSLTTSANSMVLALGIDWDHITPVTAFVPSGAHDIERNAGLTAVTWYAGLWVGQAAGTRNYGIATNSSAHFSWTVIEILAAPSGASLTLGLVTETDSAFSLTGAKTGGLGLVSEQDLALSVSRAKSRALGLTLETDTTLAPSAVKVAGFGLASETDVALGLGPAKSSTLGLASETDTAFGLSPAKARTLAQVTETDSTFALSKAKSKVLGLAVESDITFPLVVLGGVALALGLVSETDTVFAINATKSKALGLITETDTVSPLDREKSRVLGLTQETDSVLALSFARALELGLITEFGTVFPLEIVPTGPGETITVVHNGVAVEVPISQLRVYHLGATVPVQDVEVAHG